MVTASVSGRSRHGSRSMRAHRSKPTPKHRTPKPAEDEVAPKPDLEELRRRRVAYLSVPPELRRRVAVPREKKLQTKESTLSSRKSSSEHKRRRRKHHSSSGKAGKSSGSSRSRTEDYGYGNIVPPQPSESRNREDEGQNSDPRRRSTRSTTSKRHSLPTVIESEVTPDDSISQVGIRPARRSTKSSSSPRSSLKRASTSSAKLASINEIGGAKAPETPSRRSSKRDSTPSLLGSMFRRNTEPAIPTTPKLVECLTCASDDVPSTKSVKLGCGHRMCHDCLKHVFEMSVKDPAMMPPRCCTNDHIPLKCVEKLFDLKFKMLWNRKYQEYHTKNRIYCPTPKCGEWIKPTHIHTYHGGKKYAQCPRCSTKVCTSCNGKLHKSRECPKDPEIAKLVEQAKEKGWQTCYSCHAMVELKEGCNHMTCRCMAEFCMICGAKWKTCECPWFNYSTLPDPDRLNEWRIPEPIQVIYRRAFGAPEPGQAPPPPPPNDPAPQNNRCRQPTYVEEIEQRRRQERLDEDLARRMQLASLLEPEDDRHARRRADLETWGLGNAGGHFLNENFVQNAANVVMSAFGDANMGRRGERTSGRLRRPRDQLRDGGDAALANNFLGDESVLGVGPANARPSN